MKILKFIALLLFLTGISACKNSDDASLNNIEDLYAQPLPVIQKCVEGKWKWVEISECGNGGLWHPANTIVDITKDSVIISGDDGLNRLTCSYRWKEKSTPSNYTTYVMWNNETDTGEWYFDRIQNDTLFAFTYQILSCGSISAYLFYKIK